mmetsp:Transcript_5594/g.7737  ORF Transcript_5594/g.7737 Transcript_5594/m.7737 type:complete len:109 (+) Transcript_5594:625-951(+)
MLDESIIEVLATQVSVACGGFNFEDALLNGEKRHIKCSATKIENKNILLFSFLIQSIRDCCSSGFIDDSKYIKSCDNSRILGGLTLRITEISWNRNNCILYFSTQESL